eukprot:SAG31_NODE_4526_length_3164_cov_1.693312_3_plen_355_part_00
MAANGTLSPEPGPQPPFFIAAGFHKPHLPFFAPPEMFALYPDPPLPVPLGVPQAMPYAAWHSCLSDNPSPSHYSNWGNFTDIPNAMTMHEPMEPSTAARLRRGYAASVSYTDQNVGTVMAALDSAGLAESTVVLLVGDHGWSLGEQNTWCKMTNWENGVRTPFIIRAPGAKPGRTRHLAEAVDIYKTLADAVGLLAHVEASVDGVSLLPLVMEPETATPPRTASQSQFPRCYSVLPPYIPGGTNASSVSGENLPQLDRTDCQDIPRERFDLMGYSLRTAEYRITEYRAWDGDKLEGRWHIAANATELYDHTKDDPAGDVMATESVNVAADPAMASVLAKMSAALRQRFDRPRVV